MPNAIEFQTSINDYFLLKPCWEKMLSPPLSTYELEEALKKYIGGLAVSDKEKKRLKKTLAYGFLDEVLSSHFIHDEKALEAARKTLLNRKSVSGNESLKSTYHIEHFSTYFLKRYLKLLPLMRKLSDEERFYEPLRATYQLSSLFNSQEVVIKYLFNFAKHYQKTTPLHDATIFSLSDFQKIENLDEKEAWSDAAQHYLAGDKYDSRFFDVLTVASKLSALRAEPLFSSFHTFQKGISTLDAQEAPLNPLSKKVARTLDLEADKKCDEAKAAFIQKKIDKQLRQTVPSEEANYAVLFFKGPGKGTKKGYLGEILKGLKEMRLDILLKLAPLCQYKRYDENEKVAEILAKMKVPEKAFNTYLELLEKTPPTSSDKALPSVFIDGADVGCMGYYLIKLSANDPKGAFLGYLTGDCQRIGGAGERCAIYGVTQENAGFYVLCKGKPSEALKDKYCDAIKSNLEFDTTDVVKAKSIVAQSWVWRGFVGSSGELYSNTVVFDNIEVSNNLGESNNSVARKCYFLLASRLVQDSSPHNPIKAVHIGVSQYGFCWESAPKIVTSKQLINKDGRPYRGYSDAIKQQMLFDKSMVDLSYLLDNLDKALETLKEKDCSGVYLKWLCHHLHYFSLAEAQKLVGVIKEKGKTTPFQISFRDFIKCPQLIPVVCRLQGIALSLLSDSFRDENNILHEVLLNELMSVNTSLEQAIFKAIFEAFPRDICLRALRKPNYWKRSVVDHAVEQPAILKLILAFIPYEASAFNTDSVIQPAHLIKAVRYPESLRRLLNWFPEDVRLSLLQSLDCDGTTLLHEAALHPESLEYLLELYPNKGARLRALIQKDKKGRLVLHYAVRSPDALEILFKAYPKQLLDAALKVGDAEENTPLHFAASSRYPESLKMMLEAYVKETRCIALERKNHKRNTVLLESCMHPLEFHFSKYSTTHPVYGFKKKNVEIILREYPIEARFFALIYKNKDGQSALEALHISEVVAPFFRLIPENQHIPLIKEKNKHDKSFLDIAALKYGNMYTGVFLPKLLTELSEENRLKLLKTAFKTELESCPFWKIMFTKSRDEIDKIRAIESPFLHLLFVLHSFIRFYQGLFSSVEIPLIQTLSLERIMAHDSVTNIFEVVCDVLAAPTMTSYERTLIDDLVKGAPEPLDTDEDKLHYLRMIWGLGQNLKDEKKTHSIIESTV